MLLMVFKLAVHWDSALTVMGLANAPLLINPSHFAELWWGRQHQSREAIQASLYSTINSTCYAR
jgi:hypothetical protein